MIDGNLTEKAKQSILIVFIVLFLYYGYPIISTSGLFLITALYYQCFQSIHVLTVTFYYSVEYNVSYVYHALYAYFDRDNVALKGFAK